jgi:hypothetical protein
MGGTTLLARSVVYGARKVRGCTIIDDPPFFESTGREEREPREKMDGEGEGSPPPRDSEEKMITDFWGDDEGPLSWVRMLSGTESTKKHKATTFLEEFGTRLEEALSRGSKSQKRSENGSGGGFTRRKDWYRLNDIRTVECVRDMEIWVPKSGSAQVSDRIETVWEA